MLGAFSLFDVLAPSGMTLFVTLVLSGRAFLSGCCFCNMHAGLFLHSTSVTTSGANSGDNSSSWSSSLKCSAFARTSALCSVVTF